MRFISLICQKVYIFIQIYILIDKFCITVIFIKIVLFTFEMKVVKISANLVFANKNYRKFLMKTLKMRFRAQSVNEA